MVTEYEQLNEVNVLLGEADWAWPQAFETIFKPRGVNMLVASSVNEFVDILHCRRIHTTIIDMDSERTNGLATVRIIRMQNPQLPCMLLASRANKDLLEKALQLDVFSVMDKPVDMHLLERVLNRLFIKKYNCDIFSGRENENNLEN